MKQHITAQDFHQLSEKNKNKIKSWVSQCHQSEAEKQHPGSFVSIAPLIQDDWLLSIGQLFSFLEHRYLTLSNDEKHWYLTYHLTHGFVSSAMDKMRLSGPGELIDLLWEAVKDILEEE